MFSGDCCKLMKIKRNFEQLPLVTRTLVLGQYERALAKERIMAGLEAAKKRGRRGGRPNAISNEQLEAITEALNSGASKAAVCRTFGVKRSTLYDALKRGSVAD